MDGGAYKGFLKDERKKIVRRVMIHQHLLSGASPQFNVARALVSQSVLSFLLHAARNKSSDTIAAMVPR